MRWRGHQPARVVASVAAWLAIANATVAGGLAGPEPASAAGGTYEVVQCHSQHRGVPDARISDGAAYAVRIGCSSADADHALKIDSVGQASEGQAGRVRWKAPPGTGIVAVRVNANLRREGGHKARLYMADAQLRETDRVATGTNGGTGWTGFTWTGPARDQFVASLHCEGQAKCNESNAAKTWIRNVRLTLKDLEDPTVEPGGSLFAGGWLRGELSLISDGADAGGGLRTLSATVGGSSAVERHASCSGALLDSSSFALLAPCPATDRFAGQVLTGAPPWHDGVHPVQLCAADVAGNTACVSRTVRLDNTPPALAFANEQDPSDPELIAVRASDPHSGIASAAIHFRAVGSDEWRPLQTRRADGLLTARVDSAAEPPGEYELMAEATDVAGNRAATTLREDGSPMRLTFPLRAGVELSARIRPGASQVQKLEYGESSRVVGRLLTAAGEPMPGRQVVVDEYFGPGALIDHRIRTVTTDADGRWSSKLPAGPSRSVTARFAGDKRHLSDQDSAGRLAVRTGARFAASRPSVPEGGKVSFKGRVGRLGARIPSRGKLIQLQYHDPTSRRWFTVRNAFYTDARGRYRFGYRFGRHYVEDVRIRFRLRVLPESQWPYKPANTRARRVIVRAR